MSAKLEGHCESFLPAVNSEGVDPWWSTQSSCNAATQLGHVATARVCLAVLAFPGMADCGLDERGGEASSGAFVC